MSLEMRKEIQDLAGTLSCRGFMVLAQSLPPRSSGTDLDRAGKTLPYIINFLGPALGETLIHARILSIGLDR